MYRRRNDIPEERLRTEPVEKFVPNGWSGTVTFEIVNGKVKRMYDEKDEDR
jgi:hypothetical protein